MGVRNKKYSMFPPMCGIYIQQYMYIYDIKQKVTFFKEEGHQQGMVQRMDQQGECEPSLRFMYVYIYICKCHNETISLYDN